MITCRDCGAEFCASDVLGSILTAWQLYCPSCSEKRAVIESKRKIENAKNGKTRADFWNDIWPKEFRSTDTAKIPAQKGMLKAMAWVYGPRGLLLYGDPGTGKSRIAWLVAKREYLAGKSFAVIGPDAGLEYAASFADSCSNAAAWVKKMCRIDVLLMDDTFKVKLTERFEEAVFIILNKRTECGKPVIVTCNDTGKSLKARMSDDRGDAIMRRLREFNETIWFKKI